MTVELSGSGRSLIGITFWNKELLLDLPEVNKDTVLNLSEVKDRFNIPTEFGFSISEIIFPKVIRLEVDKFTTQIVPVSINSRVKVEPGYMIAGMQLNSDSVIISGPESIIDTLKSIKSDSLLAENIKYSFGQKLSLYNPFPKILNIAPNEINVSVDVEPIVERTIYNIPIAIINLPADLTARAIPATISLRVKGAESVITKLTADDINVIFDYSLNYKKGKTDFPMEVRTPQNVTWLEASPKTFNLRLILKGNDN